MGLNLKDTRIYENGGKPGKVGGRAAERKRRVLGEHLTSIEIFNKFIFPEIEDKIFDYVWVDLFAGEGNLILPILNHVKIPDRIDFFKEHIFLFDIQENMREKAIENAIKYGIPRNIARENILTRDCLGNYPTHLGNKKIPIYHITNPPYLYLGYIVKHKETQGYLKYFKNINEGLQDLYQIALVNDMRHGINEMIYIIPSNFLFGNSVSNKIRDTFLREYTIIKGIIFERKIFEFTGTNVMIAFFKRKKRPKHGKIIFDGLKINKKIISKQYVLDPKNHYRAGNDFEEFVRKYKAKRPLKVKYYLTVREVEMNPGGFEVKVIDANEFGGKGYTKRVIRVNRALYERIMSNPLFVRTVDTGSLNGKAGVYRIRDVFNVDGILVTKAKYRTHPIQVFFEPQLSIGEQEQLRKYVNLLLEYLREKTDSEFMTTYKYSNSEYTRKYLGLSQIKKLIQTYPILTLSERNRSILNKYITDGKVKEIISLLSTIKERAYSGL